MARLGAEGRPPRLAGWPKTPTGELSVRSGHLKRLIDIESARAVLAMRIPEAHQVSGLIRARLGRA